MEPMHITTEDARKQGYNEALNDCIGLVRKWFWAKNKDAQECEAEMRKLIKQ